MNNNQTDKSRKKQKEAALFLLQLLTIWLSWKAIVYLTGEERIPIQERIFPVLSELWEKLNNAMRWLVLSGSESLLNMIGFDTMNDGYVLRIFGNAGVGLGNYCLGFQLIYYFSMLVLISDLSGSKKLNAILTGMPVVIILNIFRFAALCFIIAYYPKLMKLSHEYLFNAIVMGLLMLYYLFLIRNRD